jgi:EAL domain-containing protein (putative c-di-GMP-specific phosphodiesterase class I)
MKKTTHEASADVLILDHDLQQADQLRGALKRRAAEVKILSSVDAVQSELAQYHPSIIVMDLYLGAADAVDILGILHRGKFEGELIIASEAPARTLQAVRRLATDMNIEIAAVFQKPVDLNEIGRVVAQKLDAKRPPSLEQIADGALRGEMVALFQPQIEIATGRVQGAEALVRWRQEDGSLWSPARFLDIAEEGGLMPIITQTMLEQSIAAAQLLRQRGSDISIAVNASSSVLSDHTFVQQLFQRLTAADLPSQTIKIEVTESIACTNNLAIAETLTRLRIRGIALSLDDFGTGYSSLVALHRMPFSELKIDQSFVRDLGHDHDASTIASAVIDMARTLGLSVCAEGIEHEQALSFLKEKNCAKGQGWYFGKPMSLDKLLQHINQNG